MVAVFSSARYKLYGDPWARDPACDLSDEEIGLTDVAAVPAI